jgi:imidazolonepropionase-like amidohydrolase
MKVDLLVKNAKVVNAWGRFEGWVAVQNGTVVAMGNGADAPDADQVINVQGKYVLPGAIEPHTHYGVSAL